LAEQNDSFSENNFLKIFFAWLIPIKVFKDALYLSLKGSWELIFSCCGGNPIPAFLKLHWVKKMLASSKTFVGKRNMCICWSEILCGEKVCPGCYFLYCKKRVVRAFWLHFMKKMQKNIKKEDAPV
jgi:hypothetical protein